MANFLIVDDSQIVRKTLKKKLEKFGQKVVFEAKDGYEAIEYFFQNSDKVDVVTLDISMPILNGLEALKKIVAFQKDVIAFMITSHGEESMVMDAVEIGARGYILKPITDEKLEKLIKEVEKK